jgi:hypothetical protein
MRIAGRLPAEAKIRPRHWHFGPRFITLSVMILRDRGAASISTGRTPHEVRDERCRAAAR